MTASSLDIKWSSPIVANRLSEGSPRIGLTRRRLVVGSAGLLAAGFLGESAAEASPKASYILKQVQAYLGTPRRIKASIQVESGEPAIAPPSPGSILVERGKSLSVNIPGVLICRR